MVSVGVLALQGDFAAHEAAVGEAAAAGGVEVPLRRVRRPADLAGLHGLVLPGGESTTLLKLLSAEGLDEAIVRFARGGGALLATCAGAILLSREVLGPAQRSLGLLDASIERNAYGRQVDSFVADVDPEPCAELGEVALPCVFIRAPRWVTVGPSVEVLARHGGSPILVRQGRWLAATFHPELAADRRIHGAFLDAAAQAASPPASRSSEQAVTRSA